MKKLIMVLVAALSLVACSDGDKTIVINNSDRVSDLERRMKLNEDLDATQSSLISLNASAISALTVRVEALEGSLSDLQDQLAAETAAREAGDATLQSLIDQEAIAREAGDQEQADALAAAIATQQSNNATQQANINALNAAIAAQTVVNLIVQGQIASINSKFPTINSKLTSLQTQINNLNFDVNALEGQMSALQSSVSILDQRLDAAEGSITDLYSDIAALTARMDAEGVKVYKCNSASSAERFFKINGKLYGAMNHITPGTVPVTSAATPTSVTIPKMCVNNGNNFKLPDGNGNCTGGGWSVMPGTGVTTQIPAFTTSSVPVIAGVQIALEQLLPGTNYVTTDGGPACSFNGDGTNLIPVN